MQGKTIFKDYKPSLDTNYPEPEKYDFRFEHMDANQKQYAEELRQAHFFRETLQYFYSHAEFEISKTERTFNELASQWKRETRGMSTTLHMTMNDAYLDIMAMGPEVIPFILRELLRRPDHWFVALRHLARPENPVPKEHLGDVLEMAKDWIEWGRNKGIK